FDIEEIGVQVGGLYDLRENIRAGLDFTFWLLDTPAGVDQSLWELNLNTHYIFKQDDNLTLYGIGSVGIHYSSFEVGNFSTTDSEIGIGIGAGAEYSLGAISLFAEPRFFLSGFDQFNL